ncbi:VanZ family protein [Gracilibacillus caseinilyticus]|uniref:VanZ family protein n=1 Tax=Gracilibacillus caseinilyticus TaxID=2932256 RepID=A0ABY4EYA6_9BACI|nr:VanZ family protein [Gracilibacillus caseinilyticus]UOQ49387.1 VanZ family protein [Gracilibacillus caseinilyticus]
MKVLKVTIHLGFMMYFLFMISLLFFGSRGYGGVNMTWFQYVRGASNFVPFQTIQMYVDALLNGSMSINIPIINLGGNILMFVPLGIAIPFYSRKLAKLGRFSCAILLTLFVIESMQLISRRGSFDIDDFILNYLGGLIGFGVWKFIDWQYRRQTH